MDIENRLMVAGGREVGLRGCQNERGLKVKISSYKVNKSRVYNVQNGDYS